MLGTYEDCKRLAASHRCATCQTTSILVNRWNGKAASYEVLCLQCGNTGEFVKPESLTALWRRNPENVPYHIANNLERKYGVSPMSDQQLIVTDPKVMEARIARTRFIKDLTPEQTHLLAEVAIAYGLDPAMSELIVYEGRPYVTAEGLVRVAHRSPNFAGIEDRPMTEDEKAAYGYSQPVCWLAKVYRSDWKVPAVGTGTADAKNPYRLNRVETQFPQRMARVRAIRQALKLAFPNSLPFAAESAEERGLAIDRETGEISQPAVEAESVRAVAETTAPVTENGQTKPQNVVAHVPGTPTRLQALKGRWSVLWAEATMELGIPAKDLPAVKETATETELVLAGRELAAIIQKHRDLLAEAEGGDTEA